MGGSVNSRCWTLWRRTRIVIGWLENREKFESTLLPPDARIAERNQLVESACLLVGGQKQYGGDPISIIDLVSRIELAPAEIQITLDLHRLGEALNMPAIEMEEIVIIASIALKRRGVEAKLVIGGDSAMAVKPDENRFCGPRKSSWHRDTGCRD